MHNHNESTASVGVSTRNFDEAARTWDDNPHRQALTAAIAAAIRASVPLQPSWQALEYGCGTASLSLHLSSAVQQIVAADASPGMIAQVQQKLGAQHPRPNITPLLLDLAHQPPLAQRFDLIAMAMVLHHIPDLDSLITRLGTMLAPRGWLAVADLCTEDGSFHAPDTVPHNGFDPSTLTRRVGTLIPAAQSHWQVAHRVQKARPYDIFLLTLQRAAITAG